MSYQIEIHDTFDSVFSVEAALSEIGNQIREGYTSGAGVLSWNLLQTEEEE